MLSVVEAISLVVANVEPLAPTECAADDALGLVLAEDITSDVDSPPYDKSLVDGYAVRSVDLKSGRSELAIIEEVMAGSVPMRALAPGQATRIMTGAPIPEGADGVVMVEQTDSTSDSSPLGRVRMGGVAVNAGQNIMRRAAAMRQGDRVLASGATLRAIELGLLAEVGRTRVRAVPRPTLAVLSTGDEVVPPEKSPAPGQIRNSNGPMLLALARSAQATPVDLGIVPDQRSLLTKAIEQGLKSNLLVLSGGVSAGVLDLVPSVLAELGVQQIFHKVQLKPGKPVWFGVLKRNGNSSVVFGLPGNPVSTLVCFELFVRPAIARLAGRDADTQETITARLSIDFLQRGDRPTYHPSRLVKEETGWVIEPLRWQGSGDLRTLADAQVLACFPAGQRQFTAGETITAILLPR